VHRVAGEGDAGAFLDGDRERLGSVFTGTGVLNVLPMSSE
jgi:hypothetical protein